MHIHPILLTNDIGNIVDKLDLSHVKGLVKLN